MKFLCDRCKTRYSIGDDRVRGKILKIRCKNCANVITVREGMEAPPDDGGAVAGRRNPTQMIQKIDEATVRPASPLNAAFSAQLAKPPPALEEEWYVSIDGDQSGPFNLAEAQRWVASKPFEADLHCWSEGFDDWLPVDKVSHFRGLRTKPVAPPPRPAAAPPPMPRVAPRAPSAVAAQPHRPAAIDESEPKPLFAATMASLEKSASTTLPPVSSPAIKTNGSAAPAIPASTNQKAASGRAPAIPSVTAKSSGSVPSVPSVVAKAGSGPSANGSAPNRAGTMQGVSAGAAALAAAFDSSEGDQLTSVGPPPFNDDLETMAEPTSGKRPDPFAPPFAAKAEAPKPAAPKPGALSLDSLAKEQQSGDGVVEDDGLDIGEVSRVVNLADLARQGKKPANQTGAVARITGPVGRVTGQVGRVTGPVNRITSSVARLSPAELGLPGADPNALLANPDAAVGDAAVPPPVAHSHKRGMIMLLGVAGVLLLGVVGAVLLMVTSSSDDTPMGLGHTSQINSDRPEDIGHPRAPGDTTGSATTTTKKITTSHWPVIRPQGPVQQQPEVPEDPNLKKLGADEIEDMAAKNGEGTKRCYMRAQKGALGIEIQDLKKISVTLSVDKTGTVTDVQLSDHANDQFGQCLVARIKGWRFRVSPGGTFRIALAFSNG
ncbi:MAG: zinc-ribbon domain-containing protein [Deltaproteobacteria bacterium]|nr:zinc-ribbon domain-containing protein [Deltaproteobacteria bacterium]